MAPVGARCPSFSASCLAENRPIEAMLVRSGSGVRQLIRHGIAEVAVSLGCGKPALLEGVVDVAFGGGGGDEEDSVAGVEVVVLVGDGG